MGISLEKGSSLSLKKDSGADLTQVRMGLGWDQAKRGIFGLGGGEIDLDASVLMFDGSKRLVDTVFFNQLTSKDRSITHGGDNLTGAGDGDDEQINVNLQAVDSNIQSLVFVITSYSGQKFDKIENVFCRVVDLSSPGQKEIVRYDLGKDKGNTNAQIMAVVQRAGSGWTFKALGVAADGKVPSALVEPARNVI